MGEKARRETWRAGRIGGVGVGVGVGMGGGWLLQGIFLEGTQEEIVEGLVESLAPVVDFVRRGPAQAARRRGSRRHLR